MNNFLFKTVFLFCIHPANPDVPQLEISQETFNDYLVSAMVFDDLHLGGVHTSSKSYGFSRGMAYFHNLYGTPGIEFLNNLPSKDYAAYRLGMVQKAKNRISHWLLPAKPYHRIDLEDVMGELTRLENIYQRIYYAHNTENPHFRRGYIAEYKKLVGDHYFYGGFPDDDLLKVMDRIK